MKLSLVVAVDEAWGIGRDNKLLCHLPADLQHFKRLTLGKPVLMGRKTYESIGHPLTGRQNIVLTHQPLKIEGVRCVSSLEQALAEMEATSEIMIIGGAGVFDQTLALANDIYLTRIHHQFDADTFFPKLNLNEWQEEVVGKHEVDEKNAYHMTFYRYTRAL